MSLQECIDSNEITTIYAAQNFTRYLQVTVPLPPPEWKNVMRAKYLSDFFLNFFKKAYASFLYLIERKSLNSSKTTDVQEKEQTEAFYNFADEQDKQYEQISMTSLEKDAFIIAEFSGLSISRFFRSEQSISLERFRHYLKLSIDDGVCCLEGKYWISIVSVQKPDIINPDFASRATTWLSNSIESILETEKECKLFDRVLLTQDGKNIHVAELLHNI